MKTEMYRIVFSNDAKKDLKELSKKAPQVGQAQADHKVPELRIKGKSVVTFHSANIRLSIRGTKYLQFLQAS